MEGPFSLDLIPVDGASGDESMWEGSLPEEGSIPIPVPIPIPIPSLGAVSEVSAAGVIGTGTHNTGIGHGILPTQVVALTLLLASGEILECSEAANPEVFQAARLHLGCLGIVLSVTFQCVPEFRLREVAFPSTLPQVLEQLEEHLERSQYFRFLWFPHSDHVRIIYQDPTDRPPCSSSSWIWDYAVGYYLLEFLLWISTFIPALVPWINRCFFRLLFSSRVEKVARSHRIFNYECRFRQHVQDWAIPIGKTREALLELREALDAVPGLRAHFPVEVRFSKGDEVWLSPCFRRDSAFINVILYRPYGKAVPIREYWSTYERIMRKHDGRPHWAKAHSCTRKELEKMFPAFPKFCSVREKLDPTGIFLNSYLEKVFY
ncbi:L-gulonolactone oxidase-like [Pipra filicauda]|uniref:L-gulonolactone oxidase n=1 Tax=Pipra filicauda TaxID=649802 RepID=A0A6J2FSL4_9PASS|nr:L-gulonolactone oxidase-like [Pipra filicauda]